MIYVLTLVDDPSINEELGKMLKAAAAACGIREQLRVKACPRLRGRCDVRGFNPEKVRIVIADAAACGALESVKDIRSRHEDVLIMIIADGQTPPMSYMNSAIRAEALLIKPWSKPSAEAVASELMRLYAERNNQEQAGNAFLLENLDGKKLLPYSEIYYFEARNKRIYAVTADHEYAMRSTLERLYRTLPEEFIRCHRSFIINRSHLSSAKFSNNFLYMDNGAEVALSRPYRAMFKEMFDERSSKKDAGSGGESGA